MWWVEYILNVIVVAVEKGGWRMEEEAQEADGGVLNWLIGCG